MQTIVVSFSSSSNGHCELMAITAKSKKEFFKKFRAEAERRKLDYLDYKKVSIATIRHPWIDN